MIEHLADLRQSHKPAVEGVPKHISPVCGLFKTTLLAPQRLMFTTKLLYLNPRNE